MKIEHWECQAHHSDRQLDYRNLLASCHGRDGQPLHLQHCDTKKGDSDLEFNPADPGHRIETRIRYELDGTVRSDGEFDDQLEEVLNLNLPVLRNNRVSALDAVLKWWKDETDRIGGPVPRDRLMRERDKRTGGEGVLSPYCQVVVWWLNEMLDGLAA